MNETGRLTCEKRIRESGVEFSGDHELSISNRVLVAAGFCRGESWKKGHGKDSHSPLQLRSRTKCPDLDTIINGPFNNCNL